MMEFKILSSKKNTLEFALPGEGNAFSRYLVHVLLQDPDVEIAQYSMGHPLTGEPTFYLRTKKSDPKKALEKAAREIKNIKAKK